MYVTSLPITNFTPDIRVLQESITALIPFVQSMDVPLLDKVPGYNIYIGG